MYVVSAAPGCDQLKTIARLGNRCSGSTYLGRNSLICHPNGSTLALGTTGATSRVYERCLVWAVQAATDALAVDLGSDWSLF